MLYHMLLHLENHLVLKDVLICIISWGEFKPFSPLLFSMCFALHASLQCDFIVLKIFVLLSSCRMNLLIILASLNDGFQAMEHNYC